MNKKQPSQEYILSILDAIKQNKSASAKKISENLKKVKGCDQESKIVSYPQISRLLRGYLFTRGYVKPEYKKHLPPSKEIFYKLTSKGREFLESRKVESFADMDVIIFPKDCLHDCGEKQMEKCWEEKFPWLEEYFKIKLNENQKAKIKKTLNQPVKITQIVAYYELIESIEKDIKPFFKKNLLPNIKKIEKITGLR